MDILEVTFDKRSSEDGFTETAASSKAAQENFQQIIGELASFEDIPIDYDKFVVSESQVGLLCLALNHKNRLKELNAIKTRLLTAASASSSDEEMEEMDGTLSHEEYERLKRLQQRVVEACCFGETTDECKILCCKCFVCLVNYLCPSSRYSNVQLPQCIAGNFRGVKILPHENYCNTPNAVHVVKQTIFTPQKLPAIRNSTSIVHPSYNYYWKPYFSCYSARLSVQAAHYQQRHYHRWWPWWQVIEPPGRSAWNSRKGNYNNYNLFSFLLARFY